MDYLRADQVRTLFYELYDYLIENGLDIGIRYLNRDEEMINDRGKRTQLYWFKIDNAVFEMRYLLLITYWDVKRYYVVLQKNISGGMGFEMPLGRNVVDNGIIRFFVQPHKPTTRTALENIGFTHQSNLSREISDALYESSKQVGGKSRRTQGYEVLSTMRSDFSKNMATLLISVATNKTILQTTEAITIPQLNYSETFYEGQEITLEVSSRNRNGQVVKLKKEAVLTDEGNLACEVCGFDFNDMYGEEVARNFIVCHHLVPVSRGGEREITIDDLALVCPNCHQMIHRTKDPYTIDEMREILRRRGRI